MSWPYSCAFGADSEQVCTCRNTDSYSNLWCFMPQLVFNLQFDTCSVRLLVCLSSDFFLIAVIERYIRKRFSESSLNFWSRQEKTLEILVLSEYSFIRIFFQSSVMHMTIVYASVRGGFLTSAISEVEIFLSQRALS